jgi:hypothetical protein
MALYRTTNPTWTSLSGNSWGNCSGFWYDPLNTATGNIAVISNVTDLGEVAWVWPTTTVISSELGNLGAIISYQTSTDNVTFTNAAVGSLFGRYFTTVLAVDADELYSVSTEYHQEITTKTYQDLDTTTLTGNTSQRSINVSTDFSKIFGVIVNAAESETRLLVIDVANTTPSNLTFSVRDVDTYGKIAVDGNVNITITGYPAVELDATTGVVRRSDIVA